MFEMNWLGFIAFILTAIGYVFKKYFEHFFRRKDEAEKYYYSLILYMRSFMESKKSEDDVKNREKFIEIYQKGFIFLPADVLRAINFFLSELKNRTDKDSSEIAYQKLALKIREQFFAKELKYKCLSHLYRFIFSLRKDEDLSYNEFQIVSASQSNDQL